MVKMIKSKLSKLETRSISPVAVERIRGRRAMTIRGRIMQRDGFVCQGCGRLTLDGQVDHRIPLHLGGSESDGNLQWLCVECHDVKSLTETLERVGGG